jgi:hypothetical protein
VFRVEFRLLQTPKKPRAILSKTVRLLFSAIQRKGNQRATKHLSEWHRL